MTNHQLAVMSTQCIAIFNLVIAMSNSDLAVSCKLEFCFERPISEALGTCWQIIVGKFGGGDGSKSGLSSIGNFDHCYTKLLEIHPFKFVQRCCHIRRCSSHLRERSKRAISREIIFN
jgi:hypothetical protein